MLLYAKRGGNTHYARFRTPDGITGQFHRVLLGDTPSGYMTDHISGNGLDNRRCNLRLVTCSGNLRNRPLTQGDREEYAGAVTRAVLPVGARPRSAIPRTRYEITVPCGQTYFYATHDEALRAAREYSRMAMANAS
jgi:hypothetical protein